MKKNNAGLTLVELMVSILLASILSAGLFYMMTGQTKSYEGQLRTVNAQENLWGAMEYLQRQIRLAGYGFAGCPGGETRMWDGSSTSVTATSVFSAIKIYNNCNILTTDPTTCSSNPSGFDSFSVSYSQTAANGDDVGVRIAQSMPTPASLLKTDSPGDFVAGDFLILWDPDQANTWCTVVRLTADPQESSGKYNLHRASSGLGVDYNPPNPEQVDGLYPSGGFSGRSVVVRFGSNSLPRYFAIDNSADPPRLVSWTTRNANPSSDKGNLEIIAEGIEDMQISVACDSSPVDDIFDEGTTASDKQADEWAYNIAGETSIPACNGLPTTTTLATSGASGASSPIRIVRLTLTARTTSEELSGKKGNRPAAEDHAASSEDNYNRLSLTSRIQPRNIRN